LLQAPFAFAAVGDLLALIALKTLSTVVSEFPPGGAGGQERETKGKGNDTDQYFRR
jgi:hypothetical protein